MADPNNIVDRIADGNAVADALPPTDTGVPDASAVDKTPKTLSADDIGHLVEERLKPLQEKVAEQDAELAYHRGVASQQTRSAVAPVARPTEPTKSWLESTPREQILKGLEEQPIETVGRIIDDRLVAALKPLTDKLDGLSGNLNRSAAERQFESAASRDIAELNEDYGHLKDNREFSREADAEFNRMKAERGGYEPGMLHKATTRAYNRMMREGKLTTSGGAVNGGAGSNDGNRANPSPTRVLRNGNSHGVDSSAGGGVDRGRNSEPRSFADLREHGFSEVDVRAAEKVAKRLGVPEDRFVANYWAERNSNPRFGDR